MNTLIERAHRARKNQNGFTLIELLMVIVILGVLAGIVVFAVNGINDRGKKAACQADVKNVEVAIEASYAQVGSYPADEAAAVTATVPAFLHTWPAGVDYTKVGTNFTVVGSPACNTL